MKKSIIIFIILLAGIGFCLAADPVEGYWFSLNEKTGKPSAGWEIYAENNRLYGKILSIAGYPQDLKAIRCRDSYPGFPLSGKVNQMLVLGPPWIYGLSMERAGQWSGGSIIDSESGNIYKCKIIFHAADGKKYKTDTLEMRGEIGLGLGRSMFWPKASREEALSLR
ncbi:hypothetical protein FACS1894109_08200 [Spirochaetia bacterium]|nr:hypothetical protein FACS1894109_08200 [Spirochaetia bacterium]